MDPVNPVARHKTEASHSSLLAQRTPGETDRLKKGWRQEKGNSRENGGMDKGIAAQT